MLILKQSTAVDVLIGPFVDKTDAATAEEAESPTVLLSKNGQALAAKSDVTTPTHDDAGYYNCELDATDTNTVGQLSLIVEASASALPVRHEFQVVEEAIYDAMFASGGTGLLPANMTQISGDSTAADNLEAMFDGTGYTAATAPASRQQAIDIQGATFNTATDSLEAIRDRGDAAWTTGTGGTPPQLLQSTTIATLASQTSFTLTAGSADDNAYNGAIAVITDQATSTQKAVGTVSDYTGATKTVTLSADPAIFTMAVGDTIEIIAALGSAGSAPTAAAIADAVWDEAQADHVSAGSFGVIASEIATIDTVVDGVKAVTDLLPDSGALTSLATQASVNVIDGIVDAILLDTAELQADWADGGRLDLILDAILVDTGTTLDGKINTIDSNVDAVLADTGTDGVAISTATAQAIADELLKRDFSAVSGEAARSALNALRFLRNKYSISGTTLTVTKEDDSTAAWTSTLTTSASAEPVTGSDPA